MEPPLEKGLLRKRYYSKDEASAIDSKMATATEKIIKLRVNDEVVNRELKNRIKELEGVKAEHEDVIFTHMKKCNELESNMRNEARMREDLVTKVINTREICLMLENYMKDLVNTINKCQNDRETLSDVYQKAVQAINKIREQQLATEKNLNKQIEDLKDELSVEKKNKADSFLSWNNTKNTLEDVIKHLTEQSDLQSKIIAQYTKEREINNENISSATDKIAKLTADLEQSNQMVYKLETRVEQINHERLKSKMEYEKIIEESERRITGMQNDLDMSLKVLAKKDADTKNLINDKLKVENELDSTHEILKQTKTQQEELEKELKNLKLLNEEELQKLQNVLNEQTLQHKKLVAENEDSVKKYINENNSLKMKVDEYTTVLKSKEDQWKNELSNIVVEKVRNQELNASYEMKIKSLEEKLLDAEKSKEEIAIKMSTLDEEFRNKSNSLMGQIKTYRDQINQNSKSNDDFSKEKEFLKGELHVLRNYASNKSEEIKELTTQLEDLKIQLNAKTMQCEANINKVSEEKLPSESKSTQTVNIEISPNNIFDSLLPAENITPAKKIFNKMPAKTALKRNNNFNEDDNFPMLSDSSFEGITLDPVKINKYMDSLSSGSKKYSPLQLVPTKKSNKSYLTKNKSKENGDSTLFSKPRNVELKTDEPKAKKRIFSTKYQKRMQ